MTTPPPITFEVGTVQPDGRLDLCRQGIKPSDLRRLLPELSDHPHVRHLLLRHNSLGPEGVLVVGDILRASPAIETVDLGGNAVGPYGARFIAEALGAESRVRHLGLAGNRLGTDGAGILMDHLDGRCGRRGERLASVDVANNALGVAGAIRVVDALLDRAGCESLDLSGNALGPTGGRLLGLRLERWARLRRLRVAATELGDEGLRSLLGPLDAQARLERIEMGHNGLSSSTVEAVAEMASAHPQLQHLALGVRRPSGTVATHDERTPKSSGGEIDMPAANALAAMIGRAPALQTLDLTGMAIEPVAARVLVDAVEARTDFLDLRMTGDFPAGLIERLRGLLFARRGRRLHAPSPEERVVKSVYDESGVPGRAARASQMADEAALIASSPEPSVTDRGFSDHELAVCRKVLDALALRPDMLAAPGLGDLGVRIQQISRTRRRPPRRGQPAADRHAMGFATDVEVTPVSAPRANAATGRPIAAEEYSPPRRAPAKSRSRGCYVCKAPLEELHHFYNSLCVACGDRSYTKRLQGCDLTGRIAVVTGGRIKVGYEVARSLLRNGATVIVTTRFAAAAARRFAAAADFADWGSRLRITGLDLVHTPTVEAFAAQLDRTLPRLDILINNAAQTVRRPLDYYRALSDRERVGDPIPAEEQALLRPMPDLPLHPGSGLTESDPRLFPVRSDDGFGQPIDLRSQNSWRLHIDEVETPELLETMLVNAVAPFVLIARLRGLMLRGAPRDRFVVNVSAAEGRFSRGWKGPNHPHTNAAKAALNMLTRTSSSDLARDRIYMTSVDTGWISNDNPYPVAEKMRQDGFTAPLDAVDAAARVLDPIYDGLRTGRPMYGVFLKDFEKISW